MRFKKGLFTKRLMARGLFAEIRLLVAFFAVLFISTIIIRIVEIGMLLKSTGVWIDVVVISITIVFVVILVHVY